MRVTPHPESDGLRQALQRCLRFASPWAGVVYRSASVRYANRDDLLTGAGSKAEGSRWNPPESVATLYTALDLQTAIAEALAHHVYYGFPVETALPRVLVSVRVSLQHVLNLNDKRIQRTLGVRRDLLLAEDWRAANERGQEAKTQAIGHAGGVNLVVFPGNLAPPTSYLLIVNRSELPRSI